MNAKQEKIQQGFLWALGPEARHQITRSDYRTDQDNIRQDKTIKIYITDTAQRKETNTTQEEIVLRKTNR